MEQPLDKLAGLVARWGIGPSLERLSGVAWGHYSPQGQKSEWFLDHHQQDFLYLARAILLNGREHQGTEPTPAELSHVIDYVFDHSEPVGWHSSDGDEGVPYDVESVLNRVYASQNRSKSDHGRAFTRVIKLFKELPERDEIRAKLKLNWAEEIRAKLGLNVEGLIAMWCGFRAHGGVFTRGNLSKYFANSPYLESDIDNFLSRFSLSIGEHRHLAAARRSHSRELDFYSLNPLFEYPLVRLGPGRYVAPSKSALDYALSMGIFWKIRNSYLPDGAGGQTSADDDLGYLVEAYVRDILSHYLPTSEYIPELQYCNGAWADAAIVKDDAGVMIECKGHGFSLRTYETGAIEAASADLTLNILKALRQLARYQREASAAAKIDPRLERVRVWNHVVVLFEAPFLLGAPRFRDSVKARLHPDDRGLLGEFIICDLQALETMMTAAGAVHPTELINRVRDEGTFNIHNYVCLSDIAMDHGYIEDAWDDIRACIEAAYEAK